jgi:anti-sigma factor RsiW
MTDPILDEELSALIDGELPPAREAEIRERLVEDPAIAARLALLAGVDQSLRAIAAVEPPTHLRELLRERIAALRAGSSRGMRAPLWFGAALAASLVLYLLASSRPAREEHVGVPGIVEVDAVERGGESLRDVALAELGDASLAELDGASDEEIGIALDYETLADLDVIEDLEFLELMAELMAERG